MYYNRFIQFKIYIQSTAMGEIKIRDNSNAKTIVLVAAYLYVPDSKTHWNQSSLLITAY